MEINFIQNATSSRFESTDNELEVDFFFLYLFAKKLRH